MSHVDVNGGQSATDTSGRDGLSPRKRLRFRRLATVGCLGCLPGFLLGLVGGCLLGVISWEYEQQHQALHPLEGLNVPEGRLDIATVRATVDGLAQEYLNDDNNVGLVVAVIREDETAVWGYGRRVIGDPTPPNGDTLFELASVGKTFTALLLSDMALAGEVGLHDPLQAFVPADAVVPAWNEREITLLDLATQTSGLPSLPDGFTFGDPLNPYKDYTTAQMFADLSRMKLTRRPGSAYEYSNLGYGLLGEALASVGGISYEQLAIDRVCTPLSMDRTRMTLTDELRSNLATPHDGGDTVPIWEDTTMPGAGSFLSTPNDMLRYLRLYLNPSPNMPARLVRAAAETTRKLRPADLSSRSMGLGWHIDSENTHDIVWHNGGAGGSCSYTAFTIEPPCGVVVLSNSSNAVDEIGHKVLYLLLQDEN